MKNGPKNILDLKSFVTDMAVRDEKSDMPVHL